MILTKSELRLKIFAAISITYLGNSHLEILTFSLTFSRYHAIVNNSMFFSSFSAQFQSLFKVCACQFGCMRGKVLAEVNL